MEVDRSRQRRTVACFMGDHDECGGLRYANAGVFLPVPALGALGKCECVCHSNISLCPVCGGSEPYCVFNQGVN